MTKVNIDSIKPWIAQRLTELLGMEDDVVVEFVYNYLEERVGYGLYNLYTSPCLFYFSIPYFAYSILQFCEQERK